ncbi:cell wall elongation regulator TseB-like domain-containing protein [Paraliobacillus ryukyuensis]|uniref:cell wall elongation regulator TseB-like domain-containing protein n=1 Tax=Paraliobacillus ryukyuensis TaxID=200904 RepID=UPI0011811F82|nr:DUF5590 domain-containing protein [Paraliobacillus ryukyuensis]
MRQQSSRFTVPNWIKWTTVILVLCLVAVFVYVGHLYQTIQSNKLSGFAESEERVLNETDMVTVNQTERFHGTDFYHVFIGDNKDGDRLLAYVNQTNKDEEIHTFSLNNLMTKKQLTNQWKNECESCQLLHSTYAIRDTTPLLELTYIDSQNRLTYRYYQLDNGEYESGVSFSNQY